MRTSVMTCVLLTLSAAVCGQTAAAPPASTAPSKAPAATTTAAIALAVDMAVSAPATRASPPTTASAPAVDPAARKILDDLEQAGEKYATIQADIDYTVIMKQTGDSEERTGWVAYQKEADKAPAKFRIQFITLVQGGGAKLADKVDYAFDGQWMIVAKDRIKQMTRYQVAAPGEKVEPLRLGKGPFPLPFGQKAEDVLRLFDAKTRPPQDKDPPNTRYLKLIPLEKADEQMDFVRLELWIDRGTNLPVKIVSEDTSKNVTTVVFKDIKTDVKLDKGMFDLPRPFGWQVEVKPLEK